MTLLSHGPFNPYNILLNHLNFMYIIQLKKFKKKKIGTTKTVADGAKTTGKNMVSQQNCDYGRHSNNFSHGFHDCEFVIPSCILSTFHDFFF